MEINLAVPLLESQIKAAQELYKMLPQWQQKNRILLALKDQFPDALDPDGTSLKVVVLNQFYYTNVMAVDRMTTWILEIMGKEAQIVTEVEIVEQIAALPMTTEQKKPRNHYSFASKFAHFFIDPQRFPIYDSSALDMIKIHLGRDGLIKIEGHEYGTYFENINCLKRRARLPLSYTYADLDRYLWLAGLYRDWKTKANPKINGEVEELFKSFSVNSIPSLSTFRDATS
jgi:hypothetical protein